MIPPGAGRHARLVVLLVVEQIIAGVSGVRTGRVRTQVSGTLGGRILLAHGVSPFAKLWRW